MGAWLTCPPSNSLTAWRRSRGLFEVRRQARSRRGCQRYSRRHRHSQRYSRRHRHSQLHRCSLRQVRPMGRRPRRSRQLCTFICMRRVRLALRPRRGPPRPPHPFPHRACHKRCCGFAADAALNGGRTAKTHRCQSSAQSTAALSRNSAVITASCLDGRKRSAGTGPLQCTHMLVLVRNGMCASNCSCSWVQALWSKRGAPGRDRHRACTSCGRDRPLPPAVARPILGLVWSVQQKT